MVNYIFLCSSTSITSNDRLILIEAQIYLMLGTFPAKPSRFRLINGDI